MLDGAHFSISVHIDFAPNTPKEKIGRVKDDGDIVRQEITFPQLDSVLKKNPKPTKKIIYFQNQQALQNEMK